MVLISLYWLEPEEDSWINIQVDGVSEEELREIQAWARQEAGENWGVTIPSIRIVSNGPVLPTNKIPLEDFAAAIRYNTGEGVYKHDCPVFAAHGIVRDE